MCKAICLISGNRFVPSCMKGVWFSSVAHPVRQKAYDFTLEQLTAIFYWSIWYAMASLPPGYGSVILPFFIKYDSRPHMFYFRDKCNQDNGHTVRIQCTDKEYTYSVYKDLFLRSFFKSINLRPSCYHCSYCTVSRNSDITLGDFWGIERTNPSLDDGMGNSIIICHTPKGLSLFNNIKNQLIWFQYEEHEITQPRLQKTDEMIPRHAGSICSYIVSFHFPCGFIFLKYSRAIFSLHFYKFKL